MVLGKSLGGMGGPEDGKDGADWKLAKSLVVNEVERLGEESLGLRVRGCGFISCKNILVTQLFDSVEILTTHLHNIIEYMVLILA